MWCVVCAIANAKRHFLQRNRDRVETELCEALDAAEDAVRQAEEGTLIG